MRYAAHLLMLTKVGCKPNLSVAIMSQAMQAGTHSAYSARWAQPRPESPPRCGDGYAALPLTASKKSPAEEKTYSKGAAII
jgi:hypothetical protein